MLISINQSPTWLVHIAFGTSEFAVIDQNWDLAKENSAFLELIFLWINKSRQWQSYLYTITIV